MPCVYVQNVSVERLVEVCEALKDNTVCVHFHMAGVAANDKVGKVTSLILSADSKTGDTQVYACICTLCTHTHADTHRPPPPPPPLSYPFADILHTLSHILLI